MNLTDTDYKILKLVKRKGPLDLTAIRSGLPKESISELHLRQISNASFYCRNHPESLQNDRLLDREQADGVTRYSLSPLGMQALRDRKQARRSKIWTSLIMPTPVVILGGLILYVLQRFLPL